MHSQKKGISSVCAVTVSTIASVSAHATGFDLPDQDAFAIGRGMAFVATADNPSAIYYNPAGITQLQGSNLRGGIYAVYLDPSFQSPAGGTYHNEDKLHAVPQLFYTHGTDALPLTFGFGVYSPFGLSLKWPQDTGFRTIATEGSLTYITMNPVVAIKVFPQLSIGAGLTANYAKVDLQQGLFWPTQQLDGFRFKGDGWDIGYNLGLLWKPNEKVSIGANFRSTTTVGLEGHTDAHNDSPFLIVPVFAHRSDATASFPFPLKFMTGISYRPAPNWNFEFDADYTDWTRLGTLTVEQSTPAPLLPQSIPLTLDWESSWYYEFGATRYLENGWHVSAGYIYNENSVPDAHYTPLVADLDRHFFSIGAGLKGRHFNFDFAYQFGYGPTRTIMGSTPSLTGQTADGRYEYFSHALTMSAGWHF